MNNEQVRFERLVAGGDALGHLADGRVVFVPGALPGELVDVQITQAKKDFARGEVAAIIGQPLFRVGEDAVPGAIFGYATFNDISARTYQRHTPQWTLGKNAVASGPIGSILTSDEVGNLKQGLQLRTLVNGDVVQQASTADMIHSLEKVVAYISEVFELHPGDVIATGTPAGVGAGHVPPRFLKPGDSVEVEVEKLGKIRNTIVAC